MRERKLIVRQGKGSLSRYFFHKFSLPLLSILVTQFKRATFSVFIAMLMKMGRLVLWNIGTKSVENLAYYIFRAVHECL
jgi:hypothetical protein